MFGRLHGLGIAWALRESDVPRAELRFALLMFSVGVEAGQLLFVAVVFRLLAVLKRRQARGRERPLYAIGGLRFSRRSSV